MRLSLAPLMLAVIRAGRGLGSHSPIRDLGLRMKGLPNIMYATHKYDDKLRLARLKYIVLCPLFRSMWQVI